MKLDQSLSGRPGLQSVRLASLVGVDPSRTAWWLCSGRHSPLSRSESVPRWLGGLSIFDEDIPSVHSEENATNRLGISDPTLGEQTSAEK